MFNYLHVLAYLHETRRPRTYLEVGVYRGSSLRLAAGSAVCVGVDPQPEADLDVLSACHVEMSTSDEFFAGPRPRELFGADPVDMVFIDGLHLFEFALRDFINAERLAGPDSIIVFHDCLPGDALMAQRERGSEDWAGDVWKLVICLLDHRPELDVRIYDVPPSGLCVVRRLEPGNRRLRDRYEELVDEYVPLGFGSWETRLPGVLARTAPDAGSTIALQRWYAGRLEAILEETRAAAAADALEAEDRLAEAEAQAARARAEVASLSRQLDDVYASTSWRVSSPVRTAGRQVERLGRSARTGRLRREAGKFARRLAPGLMARRSRSRTAPKRLEPASDPLMMAAEAARLTYRPLISILLPVYNTPPVYLRLAVASVLDQPYPDWELCVCDDGSTSSATRAVLAELPLLDSRIHVQTLPANRGIAAATNAALGMAAGEFVAMLDHDDELSLGALLEVAKVLNDDRTVDVVYTDQDSVEPDGTFAELFRKPDWSPEMFRGVMYLGHLLVVRRALALEAGGFDAAYDNVQDFEFALRVTERTDRIAHVPQVLYHWRKIPGSVATHGDVKKDIEPRQAAAVNAHLERCGVAAEARSNPGAAHRLIITPRPRADHPLVSVVVQAAGAEEHLRTCLASIATGTYLEREVIVAGGDLPADLTARLRAEGVVIAAPGAQGSAAALAGFERAGGQLIVSLAGDLEVQSADWLDHLLFDCGLPGVACVSPLVISPAGAVSSAGLFVTSDRAVQPAMSGWRAGADGHAGSLSCVREVSAVSGSCFAVARDTLEELGGLSPYFATSYFQAVDLSLRALSAGRRNLCTPRVEVRHSTHAGDENDSVRLDRLLLLDAWEPLITVGDRYWSAARRADDFGGAS